jgi:hypothetical protein
MTVVEKASSNLPKIETIQDIPLVQGLFLLKLSKLLSSLQTVAIQTHYTY